MIPRIIHFTIPAKPTELQLKNIDLAGKIHPDYEIRVWQDPLEPSSFALGRYFTKANSGAQLADLVRLSVIHTHGGIYLDSDMACLKPLDALLDCSGFCCASEDGIRLTNAFFAAEAGHPATRALIDDLLANEPDWTLPPNVSTGPEFFSRVLRNRSDLSIVPRVLFYPYNWDEKSVSHGPHTLATHLWVSSWKEELSIKHIESVSNESSNRKTGLKGLFWPLIKRFDDRFGAHAEQAFQRCVDRNRNYAGYACADTVVTRLKNDITVFLDGHDISVTPELMLTGTYEPLEERFLNNVVKGGDWFVDVGSNVGVFSLLAAKRVGPFGRVWSFEPNPRMRELFSKSLIANWFQDRVHIMPYAVGRSDGKADFVIPDHVLGGAHLEASEIHGSLEKLGVRSGRMEVDVRSLDSVFDEVAVIRVLKVDVEGHEAGVLHGATRLFQAGKIDYLMIEVIDIGSRKLYDETLSAIQRLLGFGYRCGFVTEDGTPAFHNSVAEAMSARLTRNLVIARKDLV